MRNAEGVSPRRGAVERELAPGMIARLWATTASHRSYDRGGGRRQGSYLLTTACPAHDDSLAWPAPAERHGRCRWIEPAADQAGSDLCLRVPCTAPGTFMYHPHADEIGADGDGHDGVLGHASARPELVSRRPDFVFLLNAYDVVPGSATPRINTMLTSPLDWNSRVFPASTRWSAGR